MKPTLGATVPWLFLVAAAAHASDPELVRCEYDEPHMGTRFRIVAYAELKLTADAAAKAAFKRVADLNAIMSDYSKTSELMRLCLANDEKPNQPVKVSDELFFVLSKGQALSKRSDGAFDVTVGPLVQLWRHARRTQQLPDPKELADARAKVGWRKVELDAAAKTVRLAVPGMRLDLGGIAKGYADDEILAVLAKHQITNALAAAGGDVATA